MDIVRALDDETRPLVLDELESAGLIGNERRDRSTFHSFTAEPRTQTSQRWITSERHSS